MTETRVPRRTREELQLRAIREILHASGAALPLSEILTVIANMTIIVFDASTSFFMLPEDGQLRTVLSRGELADEVAGKECFGNTSQSSVAAMGDRPVILQPREIDPLDPVLGIFAREEEAVVLLPLRAGGHHLGLLVSAVASDATDISFLVTLAEQASNAVEAAQLREETRTWRERLDAVFEGMSDLVLVFDREGKLALANAAAGALLRAKNVLLGDSIADLVAKAGILDLDERPLRPEQTSAAKALRGELVQNTEEHLQAADGTVRHFLASGVPLLSDRLSMQMHGAVVVWRDITERKKTEVFREEYIGLIGHDLRNPLTAIIGQADWLKRALEKQELEREARGAEAIVVNAKRMNAMIRDLVESARLEDGRLQLHREPLDLVLAVSDLVNRLGSNEDRERIVMEAPDWVPPVRADRECLERAVTNVLSNALKYSAADRPVVVHFACHDNLATLAVTDRGIGIPAEDMEHLFDRHFRSRTAGEREGLGLGLYITRLIMSAHGGQVRAESEVGKGSTFYLTFPLG